MVTDEAPALVVKVMDLVIFVVTAVVMVVIYMYNAEEAIWFKNRVFCFMLLSFSFVLHPVFLCLSSCFPFFFFLLFRFSSLVGA